MRGVGFSEANKMNKKLPVARKQSYTNAVATENSRHLVLFVAKRFQEFITCVHQIFFWKGAWLHVLSSFYIRKYFLLTYKITDTLTDIKTDLVPLLNF